MRIIQPSFNFRLGHSVLSVGYSRFSLNLFSYPSPLTLYTFSLRTYMLFDKARIDLILTVEIVV